MELQDFFHEHPKAALGFSGGVDSSVAALLLKRAGHEVIGVFMKNWEEKDDNGVCTSETDWADVRDVCEKIDIPYYAVNFVKEYYDRVFSYFLDDFKSFPLGERFVMDIKRGNVGFLSVR